MQCILYPQRGGGGMFGLSRFEISDFTCSKQPKTCSPIESGGYLKASKKTVWDILILYPQRGGGGIFGVSRFEISEFTCSK